MRQLRLNLAALRIITVRTEVSWDDFGLLGFFRSQGFQAFEQTLSGVCSGPDAVGRLRNVYKERLAMRKKNRFARPPKLPRTSPLRHARAVFPLRTQSSAEDKFCAECGLFLRDAYLDHRILHALVEEKDGNSREARQQLERLLQSEPDNVLANHMLGTFYFHQGTLDLAIERYQKAIAAAPTFLLAHYDLGVAWYHRGNMPQAIRAFRQCLEIDPNYNAAHYRLAVSLFHAGELEEASITFNSRSRSRRST